MSTNLRSERLPKYFGAVLHGKQKVQDQNDFKRFIEAVLDQTLRNGLRFNLTPVFINGYTAKLIQYLNHREVKLLCNGEFPRTASSDHFGTSYTPGRVSGGPPPPSKKKKKNH
ncbi:hypothetical protein VN97_g2403 [Penicillium thymicola]|uniref:Uncharacterized protein n=1 Tax=Penicillium thymicola TaxID=293382 RepID=A0AAI9TQI3_PENTH|nr:hypothetical protein VN97_g2403 [Penicillium thymicola]